MWTLLTNARGCTGVATRTKSFGIDEFDDSVMRRVLSEVDKIVLGHVKNRNQYKRTMTGELTP